MSLQIIGSNPKLKRYVANTPHLRISEFFCDTIQGEGLYIGAPAAFLRMQGCTLNCTYCDTSAVWKTGNPYTFDELFALMERHNLPNKLKEGQHLIFSGGSPLLQQKRLIEFISAFLQKYSFKPFIEIENECIIMPDSALIKYIDCWNNSPKLSLSGNVHYKPKLIKFLSSQKNSTFKFVVSNDTDWEEVYSYFLEPRLIRRNQIILMPQGASKQELKRNRPLVLYLAIKHNVRYSTREHIVLWNGTTGI